MARDSLTCSNVPRCVCVLCLEHFKPDDSFIRTACYHYFHTQCLHRYLVHTRKAMEEEKIRRENEGKRHDKEDEQVAMLVCPVCREPLDPESASVSCEVIDDPEDHSFVMTSELKAQQQERAAMFERQKAKGGIIDLEAEKNKFLINQDTVVPIPSQAESNHQKHGEKSYDDKRCDQNASSKTEKQRNDVQTRLSSSASGRGRGRGAISGLDRGHGGKRGRGRGHRTYEKRENHHSGQYKNDYHNVDQPKTEMKHEHRDGFKEKTDNFRSNKEKTNSPDQKYKNTGRRPLLDNPHSQDMDVEEKDLHKKQMNNNERKYDRDNRNSDTTRDSKKDLVDKGQRHKDKERDEIERGSRNERHQDDQRKGYGRHQSKSKPKKMYDNDDSHLDEDSQLAKDFQNFEINQRWRQLNSGQNKKPNKDVPGPIQFAVHDDDEDEKAKENKYSSSRPDGVNDRYSRHSEDDHVDAFARAFDDEDYDCWEEEIDQYVFEHRHLRRDQWDEYREQKRPYHEQLDKKLTERVEREKSLWEEERRMRNEAEKQRKRAEEEAKTKGATGTGKSILDKFKQNKKGIPSQPMTTGSTDSPTDGEVTAKVTNTGFGKSVEDIQWVKSQDRPSDDSASDKRQASSVCHQQPKPSSGRNRYRRDLDENIVKVQKDKNEYRDKKQHDGTDNDLYKKQDSAHKRNDITESSSRISSPNDKRNKEEDVRSDHGSRRTHDKSKVPINRSEFFTGRQDRKEKSSRKYRYDTDVTARDKHLDTPINQNEIGDRLNFTERNEGNYKNRYVREHGAPYNGPFDRRSQKSNGDSNSRTFTESKNVSSDKYPSAPDSMLEHKKDNVLDTNRTHIDPAKDHSNSVPVDKLSDSGSSNSLTKGKVLKKAKPLDFTKSKQKPKTQHKEPPPGLKQL